MSRALKSLPLGFRIKLLIKRSFPVEGREAMAAHIWLGCKVGVGEERDISQLKVSKATKVRTSLQGVLPSLKKKTPRQAHMVWGKDRGSVCRHYLYVCILLSESHTESFSFFLLFLFSFDLNKSQAQEGTCNQIKYLKGDVSKYQNPRMPKFLVQECEVFAYVLCPPSRVLWIIS